MESTDEMPSTSHSTPHTRHEDMQYGGLGADKVSSLEQSSCSTVNNSNVDDISMRVQEMVTKINERCANDQKVMDSFQETLAEKTLEFCQQMKEQIYTVYEDNSLEMQAKLKELSEILERCSHLIDDLQEARQSLSSLKQDLAQGHIPEY